MFKCVVSPQKMILHLFLRQFVKKLYYKTGGYVNLGELCKLANTKLSPKLAQYKSIKKTLNLKKNPVHF